RLDFGAGRLGRSWLAVCDRSADIRIAEAPEGRRLQPLHAKYRHRPGAGRDDEGIDARAHPRGRRRQPAENLQPSWTDHSLCLGLRTEGGKSVGDRLRHLAWSRLSLAPRYGSHADDDV